MCRRYVSRSVWVSCVVIPMDWLNCTRMRRRCSGDVGSPSDAKYAFILMGVFPSMHTEGGWSFRYARYILTFSKILLSRSLAKRKRPSPFVDCSVRRTIGGFMGSSSNMEFVISEI